ncbi:MAG TPA: xanthine dehydrogenase family protein subunit M, partial [Candidatus Acidoferrales bacterium]|nr:xanthine dehydrogenase family protein subunit M [Candidatus Acidoferrales bacterium]
MYPTSFEYLAPKSKDEAVELLTQYGEDAKVLAGGQSLVPMMKLRVARPKYLIDINRIADLAYVREENGKLHCGTMTRHVQMEESPLLKEKIPMLSQAASVIGDAQVRNRGTLGGALVEADPSGDWGPVVLALNAQMKCVGSQGERLISATDFFTFAYTAALESNEILTEIIFPVPNGGAVGTYAKLERVAGDFAIASAAVQMRLDSDGVCRSIGVGVTGGASVPQKAFSVETLLSGKKITPEIINEAAHIVQEGADPIEDLRGSAAYKKKALAAILK